MARITALEQLRAIYGAPHFRAVKKELTFLHEHHKRFIALSPFLAISSTGADGMADVSPRGEKPGFVHVLDDRTLAIPDRPGNNRIDTLSNLVARPEVGLMFLLPGVSEILRVNGTAELRDDAELKARFAVGAREPRLVIVVTVVQAYLHCAKAIMRSRLWEDASRVPRGTMPSMGQMLRDQIGPKIEVEPEDVATARYETQLY